MKRGLFIAFEGTDGSGKATQTRLLALALRRSGHKVHTIAFPQYGTKSAGPVEDYLNGKYGDLYDVGPYRGSVLYAVDRLAARAKIVDWLSSGAVVIADRYTISNLAHGGAKLRSLAARKKFWRWVLDFEFGLLRLPRPDYNVVLIMPAKHSSQLVFKKKARQYIRRGRRDIHERNRDYQSQVVRVYQDLAKFSRDVRLVACTSGDRVLNRREVHRLVVSIIKPRLR